MPKVNDRFHIPDAKLIEGASRRLDEAAISGEITERDKTLIQEFINELVGTSSISASRQYKLTLELINNREFLPPYTECSVGDVFNGIQKLLHATKEDGSPRFKKNTLNDRVRTIKRITLWMVENGYSSMDERKLRKITPPGVDLMTKTADMLLTEEEVTRMIEAAKTSRDRALISVLYEAGARIGEIGAMTWGDLNFTSVNVACNTAGKTGKPRYIPLIESRCKISCPLGSSPWNCRKGGNRPTHYTPYLQAFTDHAFDPAGGFRKRHQDDDVGIYHK